MIKRFLLYYRPYKTVFYLDLLAACLLAGCSLSYPIFTQQITKVYIPDGNVRAILLTSALILAIYLFKMGLNYFIAYYGHFMGVKMQADMRRDMFLHLERLPCKFFDDHKTGALMSRITNDLFDISELAHHGPEDLLTSAVLLIGSFVFMVSIDWRLTLLTFVLIPFMIWFASQKRKKMRDSFQKSREEIAEVNAGLENSISGIRISKAYSATEEEEKRFNQANGRFVDARKGAYISMAEFHSGMELSTDLLGLIVLCFGGLFVARGGIELADLLTFIMCVNVFLQPIRKLIGFVEQYQNGMTGFARYCEIMDTPPEADKTGAVEISSVVGDIEFRHVDFSYDEENTVLRDLSFTVPHGKTLAIVGSSGGGKTTICHLIPRFYSVNGGEILLDGRNTEDITIASLRRHIGIVAQDVFLFNASIYENIAYGDPDAREEDVYRAARLANIHDYILTLPEGYRTVVGERGVKLSGGQKQRVAIARVFLKDPPILILDEATSALDNVTEAQIQESLASLSVGRTVIVVAHRLSTVRNADEILLIDGDGIKERGTHESLMAQDGAYARLVQTAWK